jgi:hypothetical protein
MKQGARMSDGSQKISEAFHLDEQKMANLAVADKWWNDAYNWYMEIKNEPTSKLGEVHAQWLAAMKQKLAGQ